MRGKASSAQIIPFARSGEILYRKGCESIERNNYIDGVLFFRRAIEKDPMNEDFNLALAEIYTEMNYFDESNRILFEILRNSEELITDCFFGMGCNFLGLKEYQRARDSFATYLEFDPQGEYVEDVEEMLFFLEIENKWEISSEGLPEEVLEVAGKGKEYLDAADFTNAINIFEELHSDHPSLVFVRNNLSLAYFCTKQMDKACEICRDILRETPDNIHANCNYALFLQEIGDERGVAQQINTLSTLLDTADPDDIDDMHKIALTFCELSQHSLANEALYVLLQYQPFDKRIIHLLAATHFNLNEYEKAEKLWETIVKLCPSDTIAPYYREIAGNAAKQPLDAVKPLHYNYQLPYTEVINRIRRLHEALKLNADDLRALWETDEQFRQLICWCLDFNDGLIKRAVINNLSLFQDDFARTLLKNFILKRTEKYEYKCDAISALKRMGAPQPYLAYIDDDIVEVRVEPKRNAHKNIEE